MLNPSAPVGSHSAPPLPHPPQGLAERPQNHLVFHPGQSSANGRG